MSFLRGRDALESLLRRRSVASGRPRPGTVRLSGCDLRLPSSPGVPWWSYRLCSSPQNRKAVFWEQSPGWELQVGVQADELILTAGLLSCPAHIVPDEPK